MKPLVSNHTGHHISSSPQSRAYSSPSPAPPTQPLSTVVSAEAVRPTHAARSVPRNLDNLDLASPKHPPVAPPHRSAVAPRLPKNAEELFKPLSIASTDLPEWIQGYLSLLAESSTSNGSIQRMLVHLIARGAADTAKLAHVVSDPMDGMVDVLADKGTQMLLRQISRVQGSALGRVSEDGTGLTAACAAANGMNPVQGKVLSILLSLMMSGLASSVAADAVKMGGEISHMGTHVIQAEVVKSAAGSADDAADMFRFDSIRARVGPSFLARAAPSVTSGLSGSGTSLLGAGGMATSTALKMLRADSKLRSPDLGNVIGAILDSVSESTASIDWDEKKPGLGSSMAAVSSHVQHSHLGQSIMEHSQLGHSHHVGESIMGQTQGRLGQGPSVS